MSPRCEPGTPSLAVSHRRTKRLEQTAAPQPVKKQAVETAEQLIAAAHQVLGQLSFHMTDTAPVATDFATEASRNQPLIGCDEKASLASLGHAAACPAA
jgi:hypothetical protein